MHTREDFYEEEDDFLYSESSKEDPEINTVYCILCKEPLFITPPSNSINNNLIDKVLNYLKKRGLKSEKVTKIFRKLKDKPICRWDLFQILSRMVQDRELKGFFEKLVEFYDFENIRPKKI